MFSYDYDNDNSITNEVHDFSTGLNYVMKPFTGKCEVKDIPRGSDTSIYANDIKLRDPQEFFELDDTNPQYIGRVRYF